MDKENKLIPGLPSGFEDRWNKKLLLKKLINVIEKNFIKYGFDPLETPSFEISENIGSFLAEDDTILCLMYFHLMMVRRILHLGMIYLVHWLGL